MAIAKKETKAAPRAMKAAAAKVAASAVKATEVKEEKAVAPVKEEVKATVPAKEEAKAAAPAKEEAKATAPVKKAPAKKAPVKKAVKAEEPTAAVYVEYAGSQIAAKDVLEAAKTAYASTHKDVEIKTIDIYVKPEEAVAYYVVNGEGSDDYKIQL